MEEMLMESDQVETSGPEAHHRVAAAWESATAALVSGQKPRGSAGDPERRAEPDSVQSGLFIVEMNFLFL